MALSPDFVNAAFFRDMLLTDPRFLDLSSLVGGLDPLTRQENIVSLSRLMQPDPGVYSTTLQEPQTLYWLAWLFTGWVIFIESLVAVLFLWPPSRLPAALRHAALLLFCWTTYAIGTVPGFGWLLMAMAIAQCEPERRTTRLLYFWTFFLILVYARVPWSAFLVRWIG